jgi:hypothetical protein
VFEGGGGEGGGGGKSSVGNTDILDIDGCDTSKLGLTNEGNRDIFVLWFVEGGSETDRCLSTNN